jgi:hypothetical protein
VSCSSNSSLDVTVSHLTPRIYNDKS